MRWGTGYGALGTLVWTCYRGREASRTVTLSPGHDPRKHGWGQDCPEDRQTDTQLMPLMKHTVPSNCPAALHTSDVFIWEGCSSLTRQHRLRASALLSTSGLKALG